MIDNPFIAEQAQTCYGCPDQWQGRLTNGQHFYFRYRHGWASLGVGDTPDAAVDDPAEVGMDHGDNLQGVFESSEERTTVFTRLLTERMEGQQ